MRIAEKKDKIQVVNILTSAFIDVLIPNSINFVVKNDGKRRERLKSLMEFQFDIGLELGHVFISDDSKGCIIFIDKWKSIIKKKKEENFRIVHLSMYGESINDVQEKLREEENLLIVVGAEKVPREIYDLADYNVGVGSQPHSEISALAILLDRIQKGKQFEKVFPDAKRKIIPTKTGKNVQVKETRD